MKHIFITVVFAITLLHAQSQTPEQIYGNARVHKPVEYYEQQSAAWKKVVDENPANANAWYNYYYANRVLSYNDHEDPRPTEEKQAAIDKIITDMGNTIPGSYEYNLCKWKAGGIDLALLPYLEKAAALGPDRVEHLDDMVNVTEINRDLEGRDLYILKKFQAGNLSAGMMYYNYNTMVGTAPNTILITVGDNDTYPVWALQAQGIRRDITVINLSLLQIDAYRARLFEELGIAPWRAPAHPDSSKVYQARYKKNIIKHIAANKNGYPVYVALTTAGCNPYVEHIEDKLYLCGLAYLYSETPVDNMAVMKRNFEQHYALDYIENAFYPDISKDLVGLINQNYVVPMLKLYDHYKTSGDVQKEKWIREKLLCISQGTENEEDVKKHVAQL